MAGQWRWRLVDVWAFEGGCRDQWRWREVDVWALTVVRPLILRNPMVSILRYDVRKYRIRCWEWLVL